MDVSTSYRPTSSASHSEDHSPLMIWGQSSAHNLHIFLAYRLSSRMYLSKAQPSSRNQIFDAHASAQEHAQTHEQLDAHDILDYLEMLSQATSWAFHPWSQYVQFSIRYDHLLYFMQTFVVKINVLQSQYITPIGKNAVIVL